MAGFTFTLTKDDTGLMLEGAYATITRMVLDTDAQRATIGVTVHTSKSMKDAGKKMHEYQEFDLTPAQLGELIGKFEPDVYSVVIAMADRFPNAAIDKSTPPALPAPAIATTIPAPVAQLTAPTNPTPVV
jgi:hypothetical protein